MPEPILSHKITLPYPPSANRYWRLFNGRMCVTDAAMRFKRAALVAGGRHDPLSGDVAIEIVLHPKETKTRSPNPRCIDLDNALKITLDALEGIAYANDKQIKKLSAEVGEPRPDGELTAKWWAL